MNSGFRNLLGGSDTTRFQALFIAVSSQALILLPLIASGIIKAQSPAFYPLSAIVGGVIFGLAMNWGGGCAGGLLYKAGSGTIGAFIAFLLLIIGYAAAENGFLKPLRLLIQSAGGPPVSGIFNMQRSHWWIYEVLALIVFVYLLRKSPQESGSRWSSRRTGIVIGSIGVLAWISSSLSGRFFGMAIVPGGYEALNGITLSLRPGWDLFFVAGIPLGAYFSALRKNEFKWSAISGSTIWETAGGGFLLGMSASLAGGCTVGHSLTGIAIFSGQSLLFTISAIAGATIGMALGNPIKKNQNKEYVFNQSIPLS